MYFCIFSYNRGQFLANCIQSIEQCVDSPRILIFDDNSNDAETVNLLDRLQDKYRVIQPESSAKLTYKCGGLYQNMQSSLDYIPEGELAYFVQDDTQLVRKINQQDIEAIHLFFKKHQNAAFLHHAFVREKNREHNQKVTVFDDDSGTYFREDSHRSSGTYFSAIAIVHADRLKARHWVFEPTEKENDKQAREHFSKMGLMKNPFVMWLPSVPCYRGKVKTFALAQAEKIQKCGFYPFTILSGKENQAFVERSADILPIAEDFLTVSNTELKKPWITHPLQGLAFWKQLNKFELKLRKLLR